MLGILDIAWLQASVRIATSLGFAAAGESVGQRAGVLNIGLEGLMLTGALAAVLGSAISGSAWVGVGAAALMGLLVALLFAFLVVTLKADQVVVGVGLNLLALGMTSLVFRAVFSGRASITVPSFRRVAIPGLSEIPVVGPALFDQIPLVYLLMIIVPLLVLMLRFTSWGLSIRAAGEHPEAADLAGVSIAAVRYRATALAGALAGIGGAVLSIGNLNLFAENMTAGRGFIAIACVILGRWSPAGAIAACMLFASVDALQFRMQSLGTGIASQIWLAAPYVLALLVLAFAGRSRMPSALGVAYSREGKISGD